MNTLFTELQWLPRVPEAIAKRLKAIGGSADAVGNEVQALASYRLDLNQLTKLAQTMDKARWAGRSMDPLAPFRLAILSNSTTDLIVPALVASAARHGIALEVIQPAYNQVAQEAFAPDSIVNTSNPDAVLLALDHHALPLKLSLGDAEASFATVRRVIEHLQDLRSAIRNNSKAVCIFQSIAPPAETLFGSLDRALPGTLKA